MSLTKEIRDFFIKRINDVLDKRLAKITGEVDTVNLKKECLFRLCEAWGDGQLPVRIQKLEQQKAKLEEDEKKLEKDITLLYLAHGKDTPHYYNIFTQLRNLAEQEYHDEVLNEFYPTVNEEKAKIEAIRNDVQGAVLLSTTEPKLVATLTKLLNNYGGEIEELLKIIPNQ